MTTLGIRLKIARIKAKKTQKEVIVALGNVGIQFTQAYLSKIENDLAEPNIGQLKALAKIYDEDVLALLLDEQEYQEYMDKK